MLDEKQINSLIGRLHDPSRSNQAILALLTKGEEAVRALAEFLRSSKPSSLPEARLLAVEGLSILKGPDALNALISVATESLDQISDPVVRLAEETVVSRAARGLADFHDPLAREALLQLLKGKPLLGVAEAFEKSREPWAIPYLVSWLEEDFVAEAASRAIRECGRLAFFDLLDSLGEKHTRFDRETGTSQRRRARILELLADILRNDETKLIEDLLDDPVDAVRLSAARSILRKGNRTQRERAFAIVLQMLDSPDREFRGKSEEILLDYFAVGQHFVEEEIRKRESAGEPPQQFFPRESTLLILHRIRRQGQQMKETQP
jgi:HEAT repeat protein